MKELTVSPIRYLGKVKVFSFFFPCSDNGDGSKGDSKIDSRKTSKLVSYLKGGSPLAASRATLKDSALPAGSLCLATNKRQGLELVTWVPRSCSGLSPFPVVSLQFLHGWHPSAHYCF